MLNKEIPFLRIVVPMCAGIICGLYLSPGIIFVSSILIAIFLFFLLSIKFNGMESNIPFGAAMALGMFLSGLALFTEEKKNITYLTPEQGIFYCELSDFPADKGKTMQLTMRLKKRFVKNQSHPISGSILVYLKKDPASPDLIPGDLIVLKCRPLEIESRGNPYGFDYKFYMENQGIRYYAFATPGEILSHTEPAHRKPLHLALIFREKIISIYRECGISGDRLALVAAITLGQKNMLDREQKECFIKAGVMHIMAVSGLHTVILSLFIFTILFFMKRRLNILRILITIAILWGFAFVTGLTPSVMRATLMFSFLQAGKMLKRPVNGINSVLASAFLLILIRPSVIFDAGFLLSYSAVIYIIAFYNELYQKIILKNYIADKIWQSAAVTLVAQAGTLPLTISLFNRFPTYFILTNIVIVPLSSLLVITGCILPMFGMIRIVSHFLASVLSALTGTTEYLTRLASTLPMASIENIGMTSAECILLSIFLFSAVHYFLRKESFSVIIPLSLLVIFTGARTFREIRTRTSGEMIVYNTPGMTTIGIRSGKVLHLYSDTTGEIAEVSRHSSAMALKVIRHKTDGKNKMIIAGKTRLLISPSIQQRTIDSFSPDIIIASGSTPYIEYSDPGKIPPGTSLIVTDGILRTGTGRYRREVKVPDLHIVRKSGACIRRLRF